MMQDLTNVSYAVLCWQCYVGYFLVAFEYLLHVVVNINLLLTEREGRTWEYQPKVVAVQTERTYKNDGPIVPSTTRAS